MFKRLVRIIEEYAETIGWLLILIRIVILMVADINDDPTIQSRMIGSVITPIAFLFIFWGKYTPVGPRLLGLAIKLQGVKLGLAVYAILFGLSPAVDFISLLLVFFSLFLWVLFSRKLKKLRTQE